MLDKHTKHYLVKEFALAMFEKMSRCECEEFIISRLTDTFNDYDDEELLEEIDYYVPQLLDLFGINPIHPSN